MKTKFGIPVKPFRILTMLLNEDKEVYPRFKGKSIRDSIEYNDLLRTIKINPDLGQPPIVELEDYGYMVRGNNIFYQAAKEAGVRSIICDLNMKTLKDRHMSQFQLLDVNPDENKNCVHLIFFLNMHSHIGDLNKPGTLESVRKKMEAEGFAAHLNIQIIDFDALEVKGCHIDISTNSLVAIVEKILSEYGILRSVNGQMNTEV